MSGLDARQLALAFSVGFPGSGRSWILSLHWSRLLPAGAQAEQRLFQQQRFDGDAGVLNGGDDAAALGGYLNVDYAVQPLCKFAAKVAARYQMGMAVHQARSDDFAVEFHPIIGDQRGQ